MNNKNAVEVNVDKRPVNLATAALGAVLIVLLASIVVLATRVTGTSAAAPPAASPPAAPVLPLPGRRGYPPVVSGPATASQEILPNLVAQTPDVPTSANVWGFPAIKTMRAGGTTHYLLAFNSAFTNSGPGPLLVRGHRASTATQDMTADQYILLQDGSYALRRAVGALRYIYPFGLGAPHLHWHYLGAELYALYPAGHFAQLRRYAKQGFCMAEPPTVFTTYCGYKQPRRLTQLEAMLPGTTDYYNAGVEGQYIDVTGLPAGNYVLINWVNAKCLLKETTYADDAATDDIALTYPDGSSGPPAVSVGEEQTSAPHLPCPAPPMSRGQAGRYVREAVAKKVGKSLRRLRFLCARASATSFTCNASWHRRAIAYAARIRIVHVASKTLARYATALDGISAHVTFKGTASGRRAHWSTTLHLLPRDGPAQRSATRQSPATATALSH